MNIPCTSCNNKIELLSGRMYCKMYRVKVVTFGCLVNSPYDRTIELDRTRELFERGIIDGSFHYPLDCPYSLEHALNDQETI